MAVFTPGGDRLLLKGVDVGDHLQDLILGNAAF
jgi:hypothetical protein